MSADDLKWLAGSLIPVILMNATLSGAIGNDKLRFPLRIALLFNGLYTLAAGGIAYAVTRSLFAPGAIAAEAALAFGILAFLAKERDRKAINLAERFIEFLRVVDAQILYILADAAGGGSPAEAKEVIDQALKYILDLIGDFLALDGKSASHHNHDHCMSILLAKDDGGFTVLAGTSLTPTQIKTIETKFRHKGQVASVAGYSAARNEVVCMPDLAVGGPQSDARDCWIPSDARESMEGFLLCYPISRGGGRNTPGPLAVINVSSHAKKAYDEVSAKQLMERVAPKVGILIYLSELLGSLSELSTAATR